MKFDEALDEVLKMSVEEIMSTEIDPFIEEAFDKFNEMLEVISEEEDHENKI